MENCKRNNNEVVVVRLSQSSRSSDQDSNLGCPVYETEVLASAPRRVVRTKAKMTTFRYYTYTNNNLHPSDVQRGELYSVELIIYVS
jgi:hypothetical protein